MKLGDHVLIGATESQIQSIDLPRLESMGENSLKDAGHLKTFSAPELRKIKNYCFMNPLSLVSFYAPKLEQMGTHCLINARDLQNFHAPILKALCAMNFMNASSLVKIALPNAKIIDKSCFLGARALTSIHAPILGTLTYEPERFVNDQLHKQIVGFEGLRLNIVPIALNLFPSTPPQQDR